MGRPLSEFVAADDQDVYFLFRRAVFNTEIPQSCRLRVRRADGVPFWARFEGTALTGSDGIPELRVVASDVTQNVQAEQAERGKLQDQLVQAQKMESMGSWSEAWPTTSTICSAPSSDTWTWRSTKPRRQTPCTRT